MPMTGKQKLHCCLVGCNADADVEIRHGPKIDHYMHACIAHIGDLLTDEYEHTVTWLHPNPTTGP